MALLQGHGTALQTPRDPGPSSAFPPTLRDPVITVGSANDPESLPISVPPVTLIALCRGGRGRRESKITSRFLS